jgi:hypothetical protein
MNKAQPTIFEFSTGERIEYTPMTPNHIPSMRQNAPEVIAQPKGDTDENGHFKRYRNLNMM